MTAKVKIGFKQYEALLWCLGNIIDTPPGEIDPTNPMVALLREGFSRGEVVDTAEGMIDRLQEDYLTEPLSDLDKALLRVCVEHSTWVEAYVQYGALDGFTASKCRKVLRDLAISLEPLGIEINFLPE